jgi:hypothetical protein
MNDEILKMEIKNAVKEALAKNEMTPSAEHYYNETLKKIEALSNPDDRKGLSAWLSDFKKAVPSVQSQIARAIDAQLKKVK